MTIDRSNLNTVWASLLVDEFIRNGIDTFCFASGSRSAPLILAIAKNPKAKKIVHFDERGAAYFALGYGRATGRPSLVVTTSGTAVANTWPAVVEASLDCVPMIVLSADRPPELRETGANQTIDQVKLFGDYVRWRIDLPAPDTKISPAFVLTTVDQAVYRSRRSPQGPVHINCMFREPLAPEQNGEEYRDLLSPLQDWEEGEGTYTDYRAPYLSIGTGALEAITSILNSTRKGVLVVGGLRSRRDQKAVERLIQKLGWPTFADITSGLRLSSGPLMIPYYDTLLELERLSPAADVVLHLGGRVTSKHLLLWIEKNRPKHHLVVNDHPFRYDPTHSVTERFEADLVDFCAAIESQVEGAIDRSWLEKWKGPNDSIDSILERALSKDDTLSGPSVARVLSRSIPAIHALFLASSLPIRELDRFAATGGPPIRIASNRGASGIDGTVATAVGFALGLQQPVTLFTGDLALLHDLNSLSLIRSSEQPIVIVVLNNNGGGIFSFLPIARFKDLFEPYFGTPHNLHFKEGARMFGIDYASPRSITDFSQLYTDACRRGRPTLIEVRTDREEEHRRHLRLQEEISSQLRNL